MKIKFNAVAPEAQVQILDMNDYFGSGKPRMSKPMSKKDFVDKELEDSTFKDWVAASGDGDSNHALLTIVNGKIAIVVA